LFGLFACVSLTIKFESILVEFTFLIIAVFRRISLEYTQRILSPSAIQFKVEKSNSIDFDKTTDFENMQRWTEIVFVVNFKLRRKFQTAKTILENLISEINTANIK